MKRVFYDVLGSRRVTEEMLRTTSCLGEQALSSKPITPVSTDSCELEALYPNHFLLGEHAANFPSILPEEDFIHKRRYVRAQSYANPFWSHWPREYIPSLNKRVKWHTHSEFTLKTGDLVRLIELHNLRGDYPIARILKLHYGLDGCARPALVKTAARELTRPTVKLAPVLYFSGGGCCNKNVTRL